MWPPDTQRIASIWFFWVQTIVIVNPVDCTEQKKIDCMEISCFYMFQSKPIISLFIKGFHNCQDVLGCLSSYNQTKLWTGQISLKLLLHNCMIIGSQIPQWNIAEVQYNILGLFHSIIISTICKLIQETSLYDLCNKENQSIYFSR